MIEFEITGLTIFLTFLVAILIACYLNYKMNNPHPRCDKCDERVYPNSERALIHKWYKFRYSYDGNYEEHYWHPWCWELAKKTLFFHSSGYVDYDPKQKKLDIIQKAKEDWQNAPMEKKEKV